MLSTEPLINAQKAQLETLLGLANTGFEAAEKLGALHWKLARSALAESGASAQELLAVKEPQSFFALQAERLQPLPERASAYGKQVYEIVAAAQADYLKVAEAGVAELQRKTAEFIEAAAKNAPAGSENALSLVKAAVAAANDAYEGVNKAARQAAGAAEANLATLSAVVTPKPATGKPKRAA
jgi:phasin family protein